jgi:apolipoprotein N-acyltransferase
MKKNWGRKAFLPLLSGAAIALSLPGFGLGPLVFVGLVPLLVALEEGNGFRKGFLAGFALFLVDLRWLPTLSRFTWLVIPGYLLAAAYSALYFGLFGLLAAFLLQRQRRSGAILMLAPIAFSLLEILRTQGPLGIGFSDLYLALYQYPTLIQAAAFLGPFFLSATIVFVNASLYLGWRGRRGYLAAGLGMVGLLASFSFFPIPQGGETVTVALVSSDVPQEDKLYSGSLDPLLGRYLELGRQAGAEHPGLIVFPESILPNYILRDERLLPEFARLARESGASVLVGTGDVREGKVYNSVLLLSSEGEVEGTYDKVRLVPFGEYVPARGIFERLGLGPLFDSLLPANLAPGKEFAPIGQIGTPICFETTFPGPARAFAARGATLLVTVTNDAWFLRSSELREHFAAAVFRAVETRRFLAQAANGGISGFVDARGRIREKWVGEGILVDRVALREERSLYTRWGDSALYVLFALGGGAAVLAELRRSRNGGRRGRGSPLAPTG